MKGDNINVGYIDTAMVIVPFNICKNIKWKLDIYEADGYYSRWCIDNNRDNIYIYIYIQMKFYVIIIFYNNHVFKKR